MAENEFVDDFIHTWITILFISTCIISITLNKIVLALSTFWLKLRRKKNAFVVNLALTDTFSAFVLIGYLFLDTLWWLEPIFYSLLVASLNILAVALDRSIALKWAPLRYDLLVTKQRRLIACVLIWILSFSIYLPPSVLLDSHVHFILGNLVSPAIVLTLLIITTITYVLVFRSISSIDFTILGQQQASIRQKQSRQIMVTFALILGSSFLCWLPMCICLPIEYFYENYLEYKIIDDISYFSFSLVSVNLVLNPIIFLWKLPGGISQTWFGMCQSVNCFSEPQEGTVPSVTTVNKADVKTTNVSPDISHQAITLTGSTALNE